MPKKFGKNVNPSEVDHKCVRWNTGTGFTSTDSEDIEHISKEYSRYFNEKRWHFTFEDQDTVLN